MTIQIGSALQTGWNHLISRNGMLIAVALFVINTLTSYTYVGIGEAMSPAQMMAALAQSSVFATIGSLLMIPVVIIALRAFVWGEQDGFSERVVRHRFGTAFLHVLVGGIVASIVIGIGFALLIVPGIYLALALAFWAHYVVTEDVSFIEGMQRSWELTKGEKWGLLGLFLGVVVIGIVLQVIAGIVTAVSPIAVLDAVILGLAAGATTAYFLAVSAAAFNQLDSDSYRSR